MRLAIFSFRLESAVESTLRNAGPVQGADKFMLAFGWICFVGIAAIILFDLAKGLVQVATR